MKMSFKTFMLISIIMNIIMATFIDTYAIAGWLIALIYCIDSK